MALTKRDRSIALAEQICDAFDLDPFDRMSLGAIDNMIDDLRTLRTLMGRCSDIDLAIGYLDKMKRPRADKHAMGQRAKDAAVGARIMAHNIVE